MVRWGILWRKLEVPLNQVKSIVSCCMVLHNLCIDARCSEHAPAKQQPSSVLPGVKRAFSGDSQFVQEGRAVYGVSSQDEVEQESTSDRLRSHKAPSPTRSLKRDELCAAVKEANLVRPKTSSFSYA